MVIKKWILYFIVVFSLSCSKDTEDILQQLFPPVTFPGGNPVALFEGEIDDDLVNVMVPIPAKDRVTNHTGIQCVWASIECLGNFAEEPKLSKLTSQPSCLGLANPEGTAGKLKQLKVKFEQSTDYKKDLIQKSVVKERRGCLFSIPGHAMVLVHYDEKAKIIKYINNSDKLLKIRTWTMDEFNKRWTGWALVIYADKDIIPSKYRPLGAIIPIKDKNKIKIDYPVDYIFAPNR
jgi:hypothetical protein